MEQDSESLEFETPPEQPHTQIEVTLEGLGTIAVNQSRVWDPTEVDDFVLGSVALLRGVQKTTPQIGFRSDPVSSSPQPQAGQTLITEIYSPEGIDDYGEI